MIYKLAEAMVDFIMFTSLLTCCLLVIAGVVWAIQLVLPRRRL